jgi:hypothetical protein
VGYQGSLGIGHVLIKFACLVKYELYKEHVSSTTDVYFTHVVTMEVYSIDPFPFNKTFLVE